MAHEDEPAFDEACTRLARFQVTSTYGLALRLMIMSEHAEFPDRELLSKRDAKLLLERQGDHGCFGYRPNEGWWDLSNTQYAALGLRAARALGVEIHATVWRGMLEEVIRAQTQDGGFGYRATVGRTSAYSSMTVAGIAVLEICRQALALEGAADSRVTSAIDEAWEWMAKHKSDVGNPDTRFSLYFHYGLERAAILGERKEVGGIDWYERGARMLIRMQRKHGGFIGREEMRPVTNGQRGNPVDTAFAVLFLRRAFQRKLEGPATPSAGFLSHTLPASASAAEIAAAAARDARRGEIAVPELLRALRDDVLARRKAAVLALWRIAGADFGYHPHRSVAGNADALRRAEEWWTARRAAVR
jgi:hypothetical protein